jgi:hypothetical protein
MMRLQGVISSATAIALLAAAPAAQTDRKPSLVLEQIDGVINLRSGSNEARPIDKDKDRGRVLYQGDVLTCVDKASFTVLNAAFEEHRVENCANGYVVSAPTGTSAVVLERYGRTGGRSRGSMLGLLLWPASGVRTTPATASQIQWRKQSGGTLTATLKEAGGGRVLWTRSGIDAALGTLRDADLETALRAQVDAGKNDPVLEVRASDAMTASATISLLDRAAEQSLQQGLASAGAALAGDALHLVRADLFLERNLPREALDEYVAMLDGAPQSAMLLTKASALAVEISDPRAADLIRRARAAGGS